MQLAPGESEETEHAKKETKEMKDLPADASNKSDEDIFALRQQLKDKDNVFTINLNTIVY